jgi:hypothetical protein
VELSEGQNTLIKLQIDALRRAGPRPFGWATDTLGPVPVMLGSESWELGLRSGVRAALTRSRMQPRSLGLYYGEFFQLSAPLAEVTTDWGGGGWYAAASVSDKPGAAWELGRAERRDDAIARRDWTAAGAEGGDGPAARGPFGRGSMDVVVNGEPRRVDVMSYRHHRAFSFDVGDANVKVVMRHAFTPMPHFGPVTNLEPYFSGWRRHLEELAGLRTA